MALDESDKTWIKLTMLEALDEKIGPVKEDTKKHEQTLYGENGNNGLVGTVKGLSKWRWIATGMIIALSSGLFWQIIVWAGTHTK